MKTAIRMSFFMLIILFVSCTKNKKQNTDNQSSENISVEKIQEIEEVTQDLESTTEQLEKKAQELDELLKDIEN